MSSSRLTGLRSRTSRCVSHLSDRHSGRHEELLPLVEQAANDSPGVIPFKLAYGIICATIGRDDVARDILSEGMATRFSEISVDNVWMTSVIGYAVLAIELRDAECAAQLLPLIEPFAAEVAFNGVTSQGPVAAYVGKLASLLGDHEVAEEHLLAALETATAFGWKYHRATTLLAPAQNRLAQLADLDAESDAWAREASELCRAGGFRSWLPQVDALLDVSPRWGPGSCRGAHRSLFMASAARGVSIASSKRSILGVSTISPTRFD